MVQIKAFKRKKDFVLRDSEVEDYLNTFMKVIKSGYETWEQINKGIFQITPEKGKSKFMKSGDSCLKLIPISGLYLRSYASNHFMNEKIKKNTEIGAYNAATTLHHREIEELVEYSVVSFAYNYKDNLR